MRVVEESLLEEIKELRDLLKKRDREEEESLKEQDKKVCIYAYYGSWMIVWLIRSFEYVRGATEARIGRKACHD